MSRGKQSATPGPGTDGSLLITTAMLSSERTNATKRVYSEFAGPRSMAGCLASLLDPTLLGIPIFLTPVAPTRGSSQRCPLHLPLKFTPVIISQKPAWLSQLAENAAFSTLPAF